MKNYNEIDREILNQIKTGRTANFAIQDHVMPFVMIAGFKKSDTMRIVDRRLQAMKRQGKVLFIHKTGWISLESP